MGDFAQVCGERSICRLTQHVEEDWKTSTIDNCTAAQRHRVPVLTSLGLGSASTLSCAHAIGAF